MFSWSGEKLKPLEADAGQKTIAWLEKLRTSNGSLPTSKIRLNMQRVMQNNAAVFRTQETLAEGIFILLYAFTLNKQYCLTARSWFRKRASIGDQLLDFLLSLTATVNIFRKKRDLKSFYYCQHLKEKKKGLKSFYFLVELPLKESVWCLTHKFLSS